MKIYLNKLQVISALHQDGYTEDFVLQDNELFWIQEKIIITSSEFSITECYHFCNLADKEKNVVIYGITALDHNVKGILINHSAYNTFVTPGELIKMTNVIDI